MSENHTVRHMYTSAMLRGVHHHSFLIDTQTTKLEMGGNKNRTDRGKVDLPAVTGIWVKSMHLRLAVQIKRWLIWHAKYTVIHATRCRGCMGRPVCSGYVCDGICMRFPRLACMCKRQLCG